MLRQVFSGTLVIILLAGLTSGCLVKPVVKTTNAAVTTTGKVTGAVVKTVTAPLRK